MTTRALGRLLFRRRGAVRPYAETPLAEEARVPGWLAAVSAAALVAGPIFGLFDRRRSAPARVTRSLFVSSLAAFVVTGVLDCAEHFRLEKEATGDWLRTSAVPLGETAVHAALVGVNLSVLALARPLRRPLALRDQWMLLAPGLFLALGWLDELHYHRRRTRQRENIIHTTQHLAEAVMWISLYADRMIDWRRLAPSQPAPQLPPAAI